MKYQTTLVRLTAALGYLFLIAPLPAKDPAAGQGYEFHTFQLEGAFYPDLHGVNNSRVAIGTYSGDVDFVSAFSFLWRNGERTALDYPGAPWTYMLDVNNNGRAFGTIVYENLSRAASYDTVTGVWAILPDVPDKPFNQGIRMNEIGIAVGFAYDNDWKSVGWVWDGQAYTFTTVPGTDEVWTGPLAINDRGQIAGQFLGDDGIMHVYLQDGSGVAAIDAPGADDGTYVNDINNLGEVLLGGFSKDGTNQNYVWRKGIFAPLPAFPDPGAIATYAYGINERGDFCGRWYDINGDAHAFIAFRRH